MPLGAIKVPANAHVPRGNSKVIARGAQNDQWTGCV
jgi:hypothetical protein